MRSVQELVGHQDLTMTQRYSHLSPAALTDTVRLLETRPVDPERGEILETAEGRDRKLKSPEFQRDNLRVTIVAIVRNDMGGIHMVGPIVEVLAIQPR